LQLREKEKRAEAEKIEFAPPAAGKLGGLRVFNEPPVKLGAKRPIKSQYRKSYTTVRGHNKKIQLFNTDKPICPLANDRKRWLGRP
jgi:hypothetical protein